MALINCKECGNEVSTKATACPKCGAKVPNNAAAVALVIFGLVGLIVIGVMATGNESAQPSIESTAAASKAESLTTRIAQTIESVIDVSALKLTADYEANEVAADVQYKGKLLSITGTVASINKDFSDEVWIGIAAPNEFRPIHAQGIAPNQAAKLQKGQPITLRCIGRGLLIGSPMLKDCVVTQEAVQSLVRSASPPVLSKQESLDGGAKTAQGSDLALLPFTVNLQSEGDEQFLQAGITLQAADEEQLDLIQVNMPVVRNRLLLLLSSKHASEIMTAEGKKDLSGEIISALNQPFAPNGPPQRVTGMNFTSFVVQ